MTQFPIFRWSSPKHFYHHQRMLIQSNNNLKKKTFNNVPIYICWNLNELASKRKNGYNACQIPRTRLLKRQILLEKNLRFGYVHQYIYDIKLNFLKQVNILIQCVTFSCYFQRLKRSLTTFDNCSKLGNAPVYKWYIVI